MLVLGDRQDVAAQTPPPAEPRTCTQGVFPNRGQESHAPDILPDAPPLEFTIVRKTNNHNDVFEIWRRLNRFECARTMVG